jgi:protein TonB
MRDLSCYLSSVSLHALAVALITAAGIFETPDFAVTSGGVSITGSQASVAIDTRVEFSETPPVELTETSPATNPFQVALSDAAPAAVAARRPAPPKVDAPSTPARPLAATLPRAVVEPLLIPHDGLLERIGEESQTLAPSPQTAVIDPPKAAKNPETVDPNSEPPAKPAPQPVQKPKPPVEKKPQAKRHAEKNSAISAPLRETQKPKQESAQPSSAKAAAPSSNEPTGAKVEQLPRKLATNASPAYPLDAWQKQQEGVVYLLVRVSSSGLADSVTIYRSSGFKSLDKAARKTVRGWKFQPALLAGKPVASPVVVPVRFRIQRQ